jgi:hypothetical protein
MNIPHKSGSDSCRNYLAFPLLLSLALAAALSRPLAAQDITYSQDPDAAKHMTLLLHDYDPHALTARQFLPPKSSAAWTPRM